MRDALVAAADVANGAMVALVPSALDLERLALEGGEPLDQLHLTLLYLGEADKIDEPTRQALIDAGRDTVLGWDSVDAEAFAPALFNPTGDEPCAVMLCSGAELAEFYETIMADVTELIDLPDDMHVPWQPHVTLRYLSSGEDPGLLGMTPSEWASRCGPVTFDRLRFAFGGEVTDIPFKAPAPPEPDATLDEIPAPPQAPEPDSSTVASAAPEREIFDGCLRCFGPAHIGDCPPAL